MKQVEGGVTVEYRCPAFRECPRCRDADTTEKISMREEAEQEIITKSVIVNLETCCSTAVLPFTEDPANLRSTRVFCVD